MPVDSGKKLTILRILSILKKYTDEDHPMTQQQIQEKLRSEYGMAVDRGTVKNNVMDLIDAGYLTGYRVITRSFTDKATGEKDVPFILEHANRLAHFHIHDGKEQPPKNHLALGDGEIDLSARLRLAGEKHCRCVLETKTVQALETSVARLPEYL